jgi:cell division protein ZapA (FtsZ GTPase activity inhibitor)
MLNDKVEIEIYGRKLTVEMEGLTQLEVHSLASMVSDRMNDIAKESKIVDSSKLAILTAMEMAAENQRLKTQLEDLALVEERKLDAMTVSLQKALEEAPENP